MPWCTGLPPFPHLTHFWDFSDISPSNNLRIDVRVWNCFLGACPQALLVLCVTCAPSHQAILVCVSWPLKYCLLWPWGLWIRSSVLPWEEGNKSLVHTVCAGYSSNTFTLNHGTYVSKVTLRWHVSHLAEVNETINLGYSQDQGYS